ncbi:CBO0543 family protein [Alkalihalobacillus sp. BA299]|uniref:CBO0543 family protein n=1 Tax=Alkalihalobacillus sp. BA299 TaxID=2815938 RepID=UPI001ADB5347|nr:CBO0543 family protein [Alkalihalobacillus sp. BA299]
MHVVLAILLLLFNIKRKTWRNIKKHYISILYVAFFNLLYYYICKHFILWDYKSKFLNVRLARGLHLFIIMPLLTLLFLSNVPNSLFKQVLYLSKWVCASATVEWFGLKKFNAIYFLHGWSLKWSILMYVLMYSFSYFVLKNPSLIVTLSACSTVILMVVFKVPIRSEFFLGPIFLAIRKMKLAKKDHQWMKFK